MTTEPGRHVTVLCLSTTRDGQLHQYVDRATAQAAIDRFGRALSVHRGFDDDGGESLYVECATQRGDGGAYRMHSIACAHNIPVHVTDRLPEHVERARRYLAMPMGSTVDTPDGPLTVAGGAWTPQAAARADAAGPPGTGVWLDALGPRDLEVRLTADGRNVDTRSWCQCTPQPGWDRWVRYERWTPEGRKAHGWACPGCRHLVQSG